MKAIFTSCRILFNVAYCPYFLLCVNLIC